MTWAGQVVAAASLVMEMELVLEARIIVGTRRRSSARKRSSFISRRSGAASMARVAGARSSSLVVKVMRSRAARTWPEICSGVRLGALPSWRARLCRMVARAWSRAGSDGSWSRTGRPARAQTWAMPEPMVPAPMTAMVWDGGCMDSAPVFSLEVCISHPPRG